MFNIIINTIIDYICYYVNLPNLYFKIDNNILKLESSIYSKVVILKNHNEKRWATWCHSTVKLQVGHCNGWF